MSRDFLQKFIFEHIPVRGCLVRLEQSWHEVRLRARPDADVIQMLGQALCASAVLGSSIKFEGTVSLQIQSSGSLRLLLGQCNHLHQIRGIARKSPAAEPLLDLLIDPVLSINLEPDGGGTPYQGIVSMDDGSLAKSLELYFIQSEQIQTRLWLVANELSCAAFMLQRMPGQNLNQDDFLRLTQLAQTLTDQELLATPPAKLLQLLFNEDTVRLIDAEEIRFGCKCSRQRVAGVLQSLGNKEIEAVLHERGKIEVKCEYCGKDYLFDQVDIAGLFSDPNATFKGSAGVH
jgi:molecular chaperone Hsp33